MCIPAPTPPFPQPPVPRLPTAPRCCAPQYTSRAAQLYRAQLEKEAAKFTSGLATSGSGSVDAATAAAAAVAAATPAISAPKPAAARPASTVLTGARKPVGGKLGGGLGVKKLEAKVDGSLFEQAPAEAPKPAPAPTPAEAARASNGDGSSAAPGPAAPSRFAYDTLNAASSSSAAPAAPPPPARGKDGHLTIGGLAGDDFFRDPLGRAPAAKTSGPAAFGGIGFVPVAHAGPGGGGGGGGGRGAVEAEPIAQKRFASAKAISSRDFETGGGENDYDRQSRLSKFSGAAAISSDAYFDRNQGGGGGGGSGSGRGSGHGGGGASDLDLTAAELVNRLSYHVSRCCEGRWPRGASRLRTLLATSSVSLPHP
jgi:ADP-ribosylation factor GTPase-activating protein 2/3